MDGQNLNNNLDNNQSADNSSAVEPVVEPVSASDNHYQDNTASVGGYNYTDNTTNAGGYNYMNNNTSAGNYNYQDNTGLYSTSSYVDNNYSQGEGTPGLAIGSLVLGIISILFCCCWGCGILFAIPGIIMGVSANKKIKTGVGTAGIICSVVGTVLNAIMLLYFVLFLFIGMTSGM